MGDAIWYYIASFKGGVIDGLWGRGRNSKMGRKWVGVGDYENASAWVDRNTAKDAAFFIRRRSGKRSIRVVSSQDLEPWMIGAALQDEPKVVGEFSMFALPLIRKVYPPLYVNNIVSVQPMMPRNQKRKP
jgi:hypothetical protein